MQKTDKYGLNLIETTDNVKDTLTGLNENFNLIDENLGKGGGTTEGGTENETDPTVPNYVKEIKEEDIANWNDKYSKEEIDLMIGDIESILHRLNDGEGV